MNAACNVPTVSLLGSSNGTPNIQYIFVPVVLKLLPGDADAVSCKVALLIDLGNTDDALKFIDAQPDLASSLAFERAYCTYRQGRLQEALAILHSVGDERAADRLQLEAQVQYRLGNHTEAIALYGRLFQDYQIENIEIQTNVVASYAMGGRSAEVPAVLSAMRRSSKDSFELAFNVACGLIETGDLTKSEEQLDLAKRVGEEALYDEELDEDEIAAELAPIAAQLAYVAARRGMFEEAVVSLQDCLELLGSTDTAAGAAAAVNLSAVLLRLHPGDRKTAAEGMRALEPCVERTGGLIKVKSSLEGRLGAIHCEALLAGYATAALVASKIDIAKETVRSMEKLFTHRGGSVHAALLQAALMAREGRPKDANTSLEITSKTLAGTSEGMDACLMRVQLAAHGGDAKTAEALLAALPTEHLIKPAVIATRAALLEQQGNLEGAAAVLQFALSNSNEAKEGAGARWVLHRLAIVNIKDGNLDAAVDYLQRLMDVSPECLEDPELLTLFPRLAACTRSGIANALLTKLPVPPEMAAAAVDGLEASASAGHRRGAENAAIPGNRKADGSREGAATTATEKKNRLKRKRKSRLPKNFDPENPGPMPDPERWMPKWQRADAKKARKKRKDKDIIKGSQGAGKVDASLDRTAAAPAAATAPAPAKSSGNKKKGKGRR